MYLEIRLWSKENKNIIQFLCFFKDIGFYKGITHNKSIIHPLIENLEVPSVPITLLFFQIEINTHEMLIYEKGSFNQ
jgi:hypothetical protein